MADAPVLDADFLAPRIGWENAHLRASGLADQVGFRLRFAQAAVWSDLIATLEPFNLRPHQYGAMSIISECDGCKQQDIGEALGIFRSNLVVLIEELSARGLINRAVNPVDRRSYALSLTNEGRSLMIAAHAAHAAHSNRVIAALGPKDLAILLDMLERLSALGMKL